MKEIILEQLNNLWGLILQSGPTVLGIIIGTFMVSIVGKYLVEKIVRKAIKGEPGLDKNAELKRENTLISILDGTFKIVLWISVILITLSEFGVNIGPLIAGAGVVGIAVGFGGQYLIRDIITGIFILLENQYRIGDIVEILDISGVIESISLRKTTIRDINGELHHIPHGEIKIVSNKSQGFSKINLLIGISYDDSIDEAAKIINKVGKDMMGEEEWVNMLDEAPYYARVEDLADHSVILKVVGTTNPGKQFAVSGELRKRIKEEFEKAGISIPYPQLMIHGNN
jgi:small conductance mechanosensitive channel